MSPSAIQFNYITKLKYMILSVSIKNNNIETKVISTPNGTNVVVVCINSIQQLNTVRQPTQIVCDKLLLATVASVSNGIHKH